MTTKRHYTKEHVSELFVKHDENIRNCIKNFWESCNLKTVTNTQFRACTPLTKYAFAIWLEKEGTSYGRLRSQEVCRRIAEVVDTGNPTNLDDISKIVGVSQKSVYDNFSRMYGSPPAAVLKMMKMYKKEDWWSTE